MIQNGPPYFSVKKKFRWTARGRTWSSSPSSARTSSKHEGAVPQKSSENKNGPPYLSVKKKFRWTARGRTWSSPPSSARTSSILLDAPFSKCQGLTRKYYGPTIQPTTLTTPTNPSTQQTYPPTPPKTFNHEGGVPQKSFKFFWQTSSGDYSETFLHSELFCGTPPSWLKVFGGVGG